MCLLRVEFFEGGMYVKSYLRRPRPCEGEHLLQCELRLPAGYVKIA